MTKVYLRKNEVPISRVNSFFMPIHPKLLDSKLSIDENIAKEQFLVAVDEWWTEIQPVKEKYSYIPNIKPEIIQEHGQYEFLGWNDNAGFFDNGFVQSFSICREDGSIFYNPNDINCFSPMSMSRNIDTHKLAEFINPQDKYIHAYSSHNLNTYPAALLLRNWSLNYMNEVFKRYL
jgi:hypothetical protein